MENYSTVLQACPLFAGLRAADLPALLAGLQTHIQHYEKEDILLLSGYENRAVGVVLAGGIAAAKTTEEGAQLIIAQMGPGGIFGDVLSNSHTKSPVTITATAPCTVLWLPAAQLLRGGCTACAQHARLLQNWIGLISDKYFQLSRRVDVLLLKSMRAKILHYLRHEAQVQPDGSLLVPLTRAAWAAHLGCERAALCRELSRMQASGVLRVEKHSFWVV